jgi:hypothetical protein
MADRPASNLMRDCVNGCLIRGADLRAAEQTCRAQLARAGVIETPLARIPGYDPEPPLPAEDAPARARRKRDD